MPVVINAQPFAHQVFTRPKASRECLTDDGDLRSILRITLREESAFQQADAHHLEIIRTDVSKVGQWRVGDPGRLGTALDGKHVYVAPPAEWGAIDYRNGGDAGKRRKFFESLLEESCPLVRLGILRRWKRDFDTQQILTVEARVNLLQSPEALYHQ